MCDTHAFLINFFQDELAILEQILEMQPEEEEEDDDDNEEEEDEEENYLEELTKKWFVAQVRHHVSAAGANAFWDAAFKFIPLLQTRTKKVPKFVHQRRKLVQNYSPPVEMEYVFRKKSDNSIVKYKGTTAPVKEFPSSDFEKLCEMAYVKVSTSIFCLMGGA